MKKILVALVLLAGGLAVTSRDATASSLNCAASYGAPSPCFMWTVATVKVGPTAYKTICKQVPVPASYMQHCTDDLSCVQNGACDGNGGCGYNSNYKGNSIEACGATATGMQLGYNCTCVGSAGTSSQPDLNYHCAAVDNGQPIYPAEPTYCTKVKL